MNEKPRLAITMGDVNGVGPEILAKALAYSEVRSACVPIVVGCVEAYEAARRLAPEAPRACLVKAPDEAVLSPDVAVFQGEVEMPSSRPGVLDATAGRCAVEWLRSAVEWALAKQVDGIVTCPLNKEGILKAGCPFTGHTTMIADLTGATDYRMCLFTETMRIVHNTAHLSLRNAIDAVTKTRVQRSVEIGFDALRRMGFAAPRIAVAGLNPHAGEAGAFGREEIEEVAPAVAACREMGIDCRGPIAPDTVFRRMHLGEFDLVVALYHDQGHIALKTLAMEEGVNVTLGIPIVRTSVDHGTAYDIAGKGVASEASLCAAIRFALRLCAADAGSNTS